MVVRKVTYFNGIEDVTRLLIALSIAGQYQVVDRYDDGTEFIVTRGYKHGVQRVFGLTEASIMLDEVEE